MSLFENLDNACEMTVLPHPNAPGIAVVPPCTQLGALSVVPVILSTINAREESIEDTLASKQRVVGGVLLSDWARGTDGPQLH